MVWQDIAISLANLLFVYSLVYQVIRGFKLKKALVTLTASTLTTFGLFVVSISFFTLEFYYSSLIAAISMILWGILATQRIIYGKNN